MDRERVLSAVLRVSAILFAVGPAIGLALFPAEFRWAPHHPPYERMIIAIYIGLGVCLWRAAADPPRHVLLIDFTILSSLLHGGVMLVDSLLQEGEHAHLWGDVPILFVAAALLWWLRPSQSAEGSASP
jgi:hypothetical protein